MLTFKQTEFTPMSEWMISNPYSLLSALPKTAIKNWLPWKMVTRESEQSWTEVLLSLKRGGLSSWPKLAVGSGAVGFWSALRKVCPETRQQRCWKHKVGNFLKKMPK